MDMNKGKGEAAGKGVEELAMKILKKLIEPIHKDKLLDILQHAASRHIYVLEDIRKPADKYHKIFVSGLCPDTTLETLHDVFSPFGEFEEAEFPVDKRTGQSRGFAFITFKHMECAKRALKEHSKNIEELMAFANLKLLGIPYRRGQPVRREKFMSAISGIK